MSRGILEQISTPSYTDPEQSRADSESFLQAEIERISHELETHKPKPISHSRVRNLLPKLEGLSTVIIHEPEFSIYRKGTNGFEVKWHDQQMAA